MGCCQATFLVLLCLVVGFILGIYLSDQYDIRGLDDLGTKIADLFRQTKEKAAQQFNKNN